MNRLLPSILGLSLLVACWAPVAAQEPQVSSPTETSRAAGASGGAPRRLEGASASDRKLPQDSMTRHTLDLPGRSLQFAATAGSLPLVDAQGSLQAEIGFVSYLREGLEQRTRPVTFVLNGGPGAASAYLHLLALGPWRLPLEGPTISPSMAPTLVPNAETWLDFTDLVFIDPVETGYSRAVGSPDDIRNRYFSVESDTASLSAVISRWLRQNDRLASPKFLVGESYGGFRAPRIAQELQKEIGVGLNGLVMLSPVLDFGWSSQPPHAPWIHVARLPSYAAAARERDGAVVSRDTMRDAEAYAESDFLVDLTRGLQDTEAVQRMTSKVQAFTGLPRQIVERRAGRIDVATFQRELLRERGRIVSAYDPGISSADPEPNAGFSDHDDPKLTAMTAPLTSAIVSHLWQTLNWKVPDRRYNLLNGSVSGNWRWSRGRGQSESFSALRHALALDGHLHVLVAHGLTDLVTPYFASVLLLRQLSPDLAKRSTVSTYSGGHMFYTRESARGAFRNDAAKLIRASAVDRDPAAAQP